MSKLSETQQQCVGSCADNSSVKELVANLDNQDELDRINKHRGEDNDMEWLNTLIKAAIVLRCSAYE